jgi:hypothetical protein
MTPMDMRSLLISLEAIERVCTFEKEEGDAEYCQYIIAAVSTTGSPWPLRLQGANIQSHLVC